MFQNIYDYTMLNRSKLYKKEMFIAYDMYNGISISRYTTIDIILSK